MTDSHALFLSLFDKDFHKIFHIHLEKGAWLTCLYFIFEVLIAILGHAAGGTVG